ncbi:MAG: hypothetical protein ACKPKO_51545, partial [Candidatus Fonsibacter sp.]
FMVACAHGTGTRHEQRHGTRTHGTMNTVACHGSVSEDGHDNMSVRIIICSTICSTTCSTKILHVALQIVLQKRK